MNATSKKAVLVPKLKDRLRLKAAKSRAMLRLFAMHIWNSPERSVRERLFHFLGESDDTDLVYVNRGTERYLVHCKDRAIGREVFLSGQFDFDKFTAALRLLAQHTGTQRVDVLVDVGANIGTVCVPAVARGLVQQAIAIEPDPMNSRLLRINTLLNTVESRIVVHECALGERDGATLVLEQSSDNLGDHRISVSADDGAFGEASRLRIEVPSARLDSLVKPPPHNSNMLIWMDTQGYEGFVLKGATSLLAAKIPLVSEFWPYGMKRANGYAAFRESIAHYRGFIDLNASQTSGTLRPMRELDELFQSLDIAKDSYTDILVI
jgi:FkbM family methyltransferase